MNKKNIIKNSDIVEKLQLTKEGYDKKKKRLDELINKIRPEVLKELSEARLQGDLFENSEYDAAKNKQAEVQMEINQLEYLLNNAEIIKSKITNSKISIGSIVVYQNFEKNTKNEIKLVSSLEVSLFTNDNIPLIGIDSPVGKALIGAQKNDEIDIETDEKKYKIKILSIR